MTLAIGARGSVGVTILNEASKDLYKGAKVYILERLVAWSKANSRGRREWVELALDENDELAEEYEAYALGLPTRTERPAPR